MARRVKLHGGPLHGRTCAVQDDSTHFHILEQIGSSTNFLGQEQPIEKIPTRESTYSIVAGHPDDFEWDGWRTK